MRSLIYTCFNLCVGYLLKLRICNRHLLKPLACARYLFKLLGCARYLLKLLGCARYFLKLLNMLKSYSRFLKVMNIYSNFPNTWNICWNLAIIIDLLLSYTLWFLILICDALRDLVPFVQFKKREKHPWRRVNFRHQPATLLKSTLLHGCFSGFLNCTNGTKSRNAPYFHLKIQDDF